MLYLPIDYKVDIITNSILTPYFEATVDVKNDAIRDAFIDASIDVNVAAIIGIAWVLFDNVPLKRDFRRWESNWRD